MKKIFGLMLLCTIIAACNSCTKGEEPNANKMVNISFDVQFTQSGSMTRNNADDEYLAFYNKYITTKELVPTFFTLTITDSENKIVASLNGEWNATTFRLPTGTYKVEGKARGDYSIAELIFDEEINITNSGVITLTAQYGCFLLMFPTNNDKYTYKYINNEGGGTYKSYELPKVDNLCYMFIENQVVFNHIQCDMEGQQFNLQLSNPSYNFQNGHYYYFDAVYGNFNVPAMKNGSI